MYACIIGEVYKCSRLSVFCIESYIRGERRQRAVFLFGDNMVFAKGKYENGLFQQGEEEGNCHQWKENKTDCSLSSD